MLNCCHKGTKKARYELLRHVPYSNSLHLSSTRVIGIIIILTNHGQCFTKHMKGKNEMVIFDEQKLNLKGKNLKLG